MSNDDRRDPNDRGKPQSAPAAEDRGINPTAAGGPATPVIPDTGGAQAGGGPHVGAQEGSVTGVLGMGSSSVGHPSGAMGGEAAEGNELPLADEDRAQGIVSQRNVSVAGGGPAAREAGVLNEGAGPSGALGRSGSGSTTDVPGGSGRFASDNARVGGMQHTGGPSRDDSPIAQSGVRGAGAKDEATERGRRDTASDAGKAMDDYEKRRS